MAKELMASQPLAEIGFKEDQKEEENENRGGKEEENKESTKEENEKNGFVAGARRARQQQEEAYRRYTKDGNKERSTLTTRDEPRRVGRETLFLRFTLAITLTQIFARGSEARTT